MANPYTKMPGYISAKKVEPSGAYFLILDWRKANLEAEVEYPNRYWVIFKREGSPAQYLRDEVKKDFEHRGSANAEAVLCANRITARQDFTGDTHV